MRTQKEIKEMVKTMSPLPHHFDGLEYSWGGCGICILRGELFWYVVTVDGHENDTHVVDHVSLSSMERPGEHPSNKQIAKAKSIFFTEDDRPHIVTMPPIVYGHVIHLIRRKENNNV